MKKTPVKSTNLKSVTYDEKAKRLRVAFHSEAEYVARNVPKRAVTNLLNAKSKGKFFREKIAPRFELRCVRRWKKSGE